MGTGFQDLKDVAPWGRSLDEYVQFFELTSTHLASRILDCGGGPASFTAEAAERGCSVVACDPIYRFSPDDIERRVHETYPMMLAGMQAERHRFVWTHAGSPEEVGERRLRSMRRFLDDFPYGLEAGRYVPAGLPSLPFADESFDLALSSHLLFLYSDQLTEEFHVLGIVEMLRVAREARVFPLMAMDGSFSRHVEPVTRALRALGCKAELITIAFEFQRGGNHLLRVQRDDPTR